MPSDHFYDVLYRILKDVLLDRDYSDLLRKLEEDHSVDTLRCAGDFDMQLPCMDSLADHLSDGTDSCMIASTCTIRSHGSEAACWQQERKPYFSTGTMASPLNTDVPKIDALSLFL
jgi:hypothetical protein